MARAAPPAPGGCGAAALREHRGGAAASSLFSIAAASGFAGQREHPGLCGCFVPLLLAPHWPWVTSSTGSIPAMAGGWNEVILKGLSNPDRSLVPRCLAYPGFDRLNVCFPAFCCFVAWRDGVPLQQIRGDVI